MVNLPLLPTRRLPLHLLGWALMLALVLPHVALATESASAAPPLAKSGFSTVVAAPGAPTAQLLSVAQLGAVQGLSLKTVGASQNLSFSKPRHWQMIAGSAVVVKFQHSAALLPERSSLNVSLNGRMVQSIPLTKANSAGGSVTVSLPPELMADHNLLTFQVDQHYTYKCEDPMSPELWTLVRPDTQLKLAYRPKGFVPELANFPRPFVDDLALSDTRLGFVTPASLSGASQTAVATVAASLGARMGWHPGQARLVPSAQALTQDSNLILIGTPAENPLIAQLSNRLALPPSRVTGEDGLIAVTAHPKFPHRGVLVVTGATPAAVEKAARYLAATPINQLMAGPYAVVKEYKPAGNNRISRAWEGFIRNTGLTPLSQLGLTTQTARGFAGNPLHYNVKRLPDLYLPDTGKVRLTTHYSYASQVDGKQSRLEVILNGKSIGSTPLNKAEGVTDATFTLDIPATDFYTFNDLQYQFHLYPDKLESCRFVTDAHLWGTIHNTTTLDVPAKVQAALPDLGLLNDAGFPLTLSPDLSQVTVIMPDRPSVAEQDTLLQLMIRLGRIAPAQGHKAPTVVPVSQWNAGAQRNQHLVLIGKETLAKLGNPFQGKYRLVLDGNTANLTDTEQPLTRITHQPDQGVLEEILSPLNGDRVALLAYGQTEAAQQQVANLLGSDAAFGALEPGNLAVINHGKPTSLIALKKGDARNVVPGGPTRQSPLDDMPGWLHWVVIALSLVGLVSVAGWFLSRRR